MTEDPAAAMTVTTVPLLPLAYLHELRVERAMPENG